MKIPFVSLLLASSLALANPHSDTPAAPPKPAPAKLSAEELKRVLYALGYNTGKGLRAFTLSASEFAEVQKGIAASVLNQKPPTQFKVEDYFGKLNEFYGQRMEVRKGQVKKQGDEFLAKASQDSSYTKLTGGMLLKSEKEGTGPMPKATDKVKVNYEGTLIDGTVFDSSYKRGEPASFPLNGVIKCWTEGVQKMKVGGVARLVCPADMAYGDRGAGGDIAPGATLLFKVELLAIETK